MPKHLNYDEPVLRYHQIIAKLVANLAPHGSRVVDLGCGPGQTLSELADHRPDLALVGIDGDNECLQRAHQRTSSPHLINDDIQTLPNHDGSLYDVVFSSHALEHLPNPVAAMRCWAELLAPRGQLIVAVPNSHQPISLGLALLRDNRVNEGHFYVWDRVTFENFCRLAEFDVVQWHQDYVPLVPVRLRERLPFISKIEQALLGLFPRFSNSHIAVLRPTQSGATPTSTTTTNVGRSPEQSSSMVKMARS